MLCGSPAFGAQPVASLLAAQFATTMLFDDVALRAALSANRGSQSLFNHCRWAGYMATPDV